MKIMCSSFYIYTPTLQCIIALGSNSRIWVGEVLVQSLIKMEPKKVKRVVKLDFNSPPSRQLGTEEYMNHFNIITK